MTTSLGRRRVRTLLLFAVLTPLIVTTGSAAMPATATTMAEAATVDASGVPRPARAAAVSGPLRAGEWTKVLWGWGYYSVRYTTSTSAPGGEYRCYSPPWPWPTSSGGLPAYITHRVNGYGDCWLRSPVDATYYLNPA